MQKHIHEEKKNTNEQLFEASFKDDFNSTFTRLTEIQEEIITKKIEELEAQLQEIENAVIEIINRAQRRKS